MLKVRVNITHLPEWLKKKRLKMQSVYEDVEQKCRVFMRMWSNWKIDCWWECEFVLATLRNCLEEFTKAKYVHIFCPNNSILWNICKSNVYQCSLKMTCTRIFLLLHTL